MTSVHEDSVSDSPDESELIATQTERDIQELIQEKYGNLPKTTFKEHIINDVSNADIEQFRRSLYDLALQTIPNTPRGKLAIRKYRSGGATVEDKLTDDIYLLTHYLQGDTTIDLTPCLSEKSKKALQKRPNGYTSVLRYTNSNASFSALPNQSTVGDTTTAAQESDIPLHEFCVSLLAEMRKDRDVLIRQVTALRSDSALLSQVRDDVREIRHEITLTRDRVSKLEVLLPQRIEEQREYDSENTAPKRGISETCKQIQKTVTKLQKRTTGLEQSIGSVTSAGKEITIRVGNNYASLTQRMNQLELVVGIQSSVKHSNLTRQPGQPSASVQSPDSTPDKRSFGSTQKSRKSGLPCEVVLTCPDTDETNRQERNVTQVLDNYADQPIPRDTEPRFTVEIPEPIEQHSTDTIETKDQHHIDESRGHAVHKDTRGLQGYIPAEKRPRFKVFFVSGIFRSREDIEDTIHKIQGYIESNGCKVKSIRRLKHTHRTLSVKIVVFEESAEIISANTFWPEDIQCRPRED